MSTHALLLPAMQSRPLGAVRAALDRRPRLVVVLLLSIPLLWLGVIYLGSLASLLAQSFFHLDDFSGKIVREVTLATYAQVLTAANLSVIARTVTMAAAVTVAAAVIAFPLAYYMSRHASPHMRAALYLAVMLPLWSSYLVRVYAWKMILAKEGILTWLAAMLGLTPVLNAALTLPVIGGPSLATSYLGTFMVLLYVWLPYMILPVVVALDRLPQSTLDAAADLGAGPRASLWTVILPLAFPGIVAGSIFTFSLSLGDYIVPNMVGPGRPFLGQIVIAQQGIAGNVPLAAALSVVPIVVMSLYLYAARRLGAFNAL